MYQSPDNNNSNTNYSNNNTLTLLRNIRDLLPAILCRNSFPGKYDETTSISVDINSDPQDPANLSIGVEPPGLLNFILERLGEIKGDASGIKAGLSQGYISPLRQMEVIVKEVLTREEFIGNIVGYGAKDGQVMFDFHNAQSAQYVINKLQQYTGNFTYDLYNFESSNKVRLIVASQAVEAWCKNAGDFLSLGASPEAKVKYWTLRHFSDDNQALYKPQFTMVPNIEGTGKSHICITYQEDINGSGKDKITDAIREGLTGYSSSYLVFRDKAIYIPINNILAEALHFTAQQHAADDNFYAQLHSGRIIPTFSGFTQLGSVRHGIQLQQHTQRGVESFTANLLNQTNENNEQSVPRQGKAYITHLADTKYAPTLRINIPVLDRINEGKLERAV